MYSLQVTFQCLNEDPFLAVTWNIYVEFLLKYFRGRADQF